MNHTGNKAYTGSDYGLEYYNDSLAQWQNALPPNYAYTLDLHIIEPNDSCNMGIYMFNSKPGKYKVAKQVSVNYKLNNTSTNYPLMGVFIYSDTLK